MKNYIVLDLEWNQSAKGKSGSAPQIPFEIIEIGAVKLDEKLEETDSFRQLIRPDIYPELHEKIRQVTHMDTKALMEEGISFPEAAAEFMSWCGEGVFCTWGSMDLTELQRNFAFYEMENPFPNPLLYLDVQKLYSLRYVKGKERLSLDVAVGELGLREKRPFHQALDDAHYTGRIMKEMDFKRVESYFSTDYYRLPQNEEEEVYLVFPDYSKYISRLFDTKQEAFLDKRVTDLLCCKCNRMLRKKIRWFSVNQKFYTALGCCPEHGNVKGKIRVRKNEDGRVYIVKTMKLVEEAGVGELYEKWEDAQKKKGERVKSRKQNKKKGVLPLS